MDFNCPECGFSHSHDDSAEEAAEVVVEETVEADVLIAEIEANRDVTIAKIAAKAEESHDETEVEVLRGEMRVLREMVERLSPAPEPEPVPVVLDPPAQELPSEPAPEPRGDAAPEPKSRQRKNPFWG